MESVGILSRVHIENHNSGDEVMADVLLLSLESLDETVEMYKEDDRFVVYHDAACYLDDGTEVIISRNKAFDDLEEAHSQFCEYAEDLYKPFSRLGLVEEEDEDGTLVLEIAYDGDVELLNEQLTAFLEELGIVSVSNEEFDTRQALEGLLEE